MHTSHLPYVLASLFGCSTVGDSPPAPMPSGGAEPEPTTPKLESIAGGSFTAIGSPAPLRGRALLVRRLDGKTDVSLALATSVANASFVAHVHTTPCRFQGGGHYKIDPSIATTEAANELWLSGTATSQGMLFARATFAHLVRGSALSILVHDPMGAKLACADLVEKEPATLGLAGVVQALPGVPAVDATVSGMIQATTNIAGSTFRLDLFGLDITAVGYETHVHAEPCELGGGGGHYKHDPTIVQTLESNEVWLPVASGRSTILSLGTRPQPLRRDAQSLVVHRVKTQIDKPKIACANLKQTSDHAAFESLGSAQRLSGANGRTVVGTAIMTRKLTGVTVLSVVATGLEPDAVYQAHLHDQPCSVGEGGGHYKHDRSVAGTEEQNEVWFELAADANGAAFDATWIFGTPAADALSIVLHHPAGRLACFELE